MVNKVITYISLCVPIPSFSDTVSRSSVYCAVSTAIEQCNTEREVDVFQIVKAIRINQPGAIPELVCAKQTSLTEDNIL